MTTTTDQLWICNRCGMIYDPAEGDPDGGVGPRHGLRRHPRRLGLPVCGAAKSDFVPYED